MLPFLALKHTHSISLKLVWQYHILKGIAYLASIPLMSTMLKLPRFRLNIMEQK